MYRILLFSLPCSCKVLDLYFIIHFLYLYFHEMFTLLLFPHGHQFKKKNVNFVYYACGCVWCALILVGVYNALLLGISVLLDVILFYR